MKSKVIIFCGSFLLLFWSDVFAQHASKVIKPSPFLAASHMQQMNVTSFTQSCSVDTVLLTSQSQIDNFSAVYPACTMPNFLIINGSGAGPAITNLAGLSGVSAVVKKLQINNTSLTSLSSLAGLTQVDTLELHDNPLLTGIGLNNLTYLDAIVFVNLPSLNTVGGLSNHIDSIGSLHIDSTGLSNLSGLSNITRIVAGGIDIEHSPVVNLAALNSITYIRDYLYLQDDQSLTSISMNNIHSCAGFLLGGALQQLTDIHGLADHLDNRNIGSLWIIQTGLTSLAGLDSLTGVSNFYIWLNPELTNIQGLSNLTGHIDYGISIWENPLVSTLAPLSAVTNVDEGTVAVTSSNGLTSLNGLQNIINIGGGLFINGDNGLDSLTDLNPSLVIHDDNLDLVKIYNNQQLVTCSFPPLCNYIAAGGSTEIHDNAPGCASSSEILSACTTATDCPDPDAKTWNGSVSSDWGNPANWTPAGVPAECTMVTIPDQNTLANSPLANANLKIRGLTMEDNAYLSMEFYNIIITKTLNLDNSEIENAGNVLAAGIFEPAVNNTYIQGNFSCTDFGGAAEFHSNTIDGNTVLSDSTGRDAACHVSYNNFYGNLTCTLNSEYGNFYLSNETGYYANDYVDGNLRIINNSPGQFSVGAGVYRPLKVNGDFIITTNNTGPIDIGTLTFTGYKSAHLGKTGGGAFGMANLIMEKYNDVILDNDIYVYSTLRLDGYCGDINTTSLKKIILNNGANTSADGSCGIVNGPIKKTGNQAVTFPIGKVENGTRWKAFLSISAPASPTDEFTAEYFHHDPSVDGYDTAQVTGINNVSGKEYWNLARNVGTSNVSVTLPYDSNRSGVQYNYTLAQVAGWNGTHWRSWGSGGYTGYIFGGTLLSGTPVDQFGPFTFSFKPVRKPVITLSNIDTIHCASGNWYLPFTLDTSMIQGNIFYARISDTSGVFSGESNYIGYKQSSATSDSISCFFPGWVVAGKQYKVRITATQPADTSINTRTVVFMFPPQQTISIVYPPNACLGSTQKYYPATHEPGASYVWNLNYGGTIVTSGDTAYITWTATGDQYLTVHSVGLCGYGSQTALTVFVNPPTPTFTPVINNTGRWLYGSTAPAGAGYQWYRGAVALPGASNSTYYASLAGSYTLQYSGACGNSPASNTITFGANALTQNISFPALADKTFGDAPFLPAATASSGLPVSFSVISGPATVNTQTNFVSITGTGIVTLRANQPGNDIYDTAAAVIHTFNVNKGTQTISFTAIADHDISNDTIQLAALSSAGLPVSFTIVSGPATLSGNVLTLTGIGTITVKASQPGDNNYLAAADITKSFCSYVTHLGSISGFTDLCPGATTYSVGNITGATYHWRIVGGSNPASATNAVNITWPSPGDYTLIVYATGSCGSASANDSLHVHVISSLAPDSVHGMIPANGAINQQLPLTLSWIPAQPGSFYTFDLYIWKASDPQPSTPVAAGITTVNYTIPVSSGLLSNTPYKWLIVAHNGSCTQINTGITQQFTLVPLPDLIVNNVQAPATAFSGQSITINWTVSNPGPGKTTTNQSWTDGVFLSFDTLPHFNIPPNTNPGAWSQLDFPLKPLLIATRPNISALDPGQSYSNSVNFTLPANYSQPLYVYVITNYPRGSNAPQQQTYVNDTAHGPQPIAITLSPTPDLRVDTVFTPNTTFSGSTISLTYKVKNYGVVTPPNTAWNDRFYISQSPIFDAQNAVLLKAPKANGTYYANAYDAFAGHSAQLLPDSSYSNNVNLVIPNYIFGSFFIHVFTNTGQSVYEGALADNNVNHSRVQVFLTPTPHLTLSAVTLPVTAASTTQPVSVNWNILNAGFNDNIERNKGHYFVNGGSCLIYPPPCTCTTPNCICVTSPPSTGILLIDNPGFGGSYWRNNIYLSTDSALTAATISSAINLGSNNQGNLNSGLDIPDYYSNPLADGCHPAGTSGTQYNANTYNVITPNGNYPYAYNFNMPDYLLPGNYYVYVYANSTHTVYEYPGTPEIKRAALPITVQRPDARVSVSSVPAAVTGGQNFTLGYDVTNNGPGKVFNHLRHDNIYVSSSPAFDGSAQLIMTQTFTEDLPAGTAVPHSFSYAFPIAASGTKYFYIHTNYDSLFRETNSANNISPASSAVSVTPGAPADLIVSAVQLADTVYTVYPTYIKYTVPNTGVGITTGAWTDSIFISCNPMFNNATNIFAAKRFHTAPVAPGGSYTDSFYVNLPMSFELSTCFPTDSVNTAYFFIKTNADGGVYEGMNGNNNVTVTGSRVLINPLVDHIVTTVNGGDTATVARLYAMGWTVKNIGANPGGYYYSGWYDGVYFSPDSVFNANAVLANYYGQNTLLNHNQTYSDQKSITVPNIPTGDYYLIARSNTNNQIGGEHNIANNFNVLRNGAGAAKKVHVIQPLLPDLTDSILSCPATVATGQPLILIHRVTNIGAGVTYPGSWSDDVVLSADFLPGNTGDITLSGKNHVGALQPGQFFDDTVTAIIALNTLPANYVLISRVNSTNNLFETNAGNNLAFKYINVYSPAPADLIVANVSRPDTVYLGYEMDTAKWVIQNNSPNTASGVSSDGVYLSTGAVLDSTAILVGIKSKLINMSPLAKDTLTLTPVINNVTEGAYHMLVKTDLLNNIVETDKGNNVGISAGSVYVGVKELRLSTLTPNTLYNISRYYKLVIPDSLAGSTIRVQLKSNDSLSMTNQMFIGLGYIPSAAHFTFTYDTPNYGNQDIIITSVIAGTYYITVHCASVNPVTQNITLKAEKLPFLITGVQSSSGGNIGNVTVKISGSLFVNNMSAKLSSGSTVINAPFVYFTNSTIVYATFNLQGKPLGIYDVTLTKPDTTMAVLPQSFSIVAANNGGLNTGGGVNTGAGDGTAPGCDPGAAAGINSQMVTQMVVPDKVFAGWPFVIQINYNNPTNSDIPAQVRTLYSERNILMALSPQTVSSGATVLTLNLTEQNGPPGIIRAGGSGTITVYAKAPLDIPGHTTVYFRLK